MQRDRLRLRIRITVAALLIVVALLAWRYFPLAAPRLQWPRGELTIGPAEPLPGARLRFAVIGDYGHTSANAARVAALVGGWNPDFVLTTGDNNYPAGAAETIDENIGRGYSPFIGDYSGDYGGGSATNRFWPSLGNHDFVGLTCDGVTCRGPYLDYFTLPGNERYYDVDLGPVHLFAVNSVPGEPDGVTADSPQATWLRDALAASDACFDVVYFHHAPYSTGRHGSTATMRWPFAAWGADVVFSGHEHSYERLDVSGTPYFVVGAGGRSLYRFLHLDDLPPEATSQARYNRDYGALLMTVTGEWLVAEYYNVWGELIDEYLMPGECAA